ncbi:MULTISPECIES: hypothetical protein [unclassified Mesorhizobium]|uniref:hypothetical protein n=1 Tax=unclassified Mesorhizobium TaxID=325217 RepID=UPI0033397173
MRPPLRLWFIVVGLLLAPNDVSVSGELDLISPIDVPGEWRKLESEYRTQVDDLREKRKERGEKAQSVNEKLDAIDFAKVSEQAKQDMDEGLRDMGESLGDAFTEYMSGPGKRSNVLETGRILLTETLPAFEQVLDAEYAEVDMQFEMEQLQSELSGYENEMKDFDKKIADLELNADLSKKVAETYEQQLNDTKTKTKEIVFKLVETSRAVKAVAQEKHDTIPPGWLACTCPNDHAGLGRLIKGVRYHEPGHTCPAH